jgi:hypothetical protein
MVLLLLLLHSNGENLTTAIYLRMGWSIASQVVLPSGLSSDGKSRIVEKRELTKVMVEAFELIRIDAMKLVHTYFPSVQLLSFISKSAAVIAIVNSILNHCHEFFKSCVNLKTIFLVFDGPVSKLKQNEVNSKYGDIMSKKTKAQQLVSRLAKIDRDDDNFESYQKDFVDAGHLAKNAALYPTLSCSFMRYCLLACRIQQTKTYIVTLPLTTVKLIILS